MPKHVGTWRNVERTGDRDVDGNSWLQRIADRHAPGCDNLRSFDLDPAPFCDLCGNFLFAVEATRTVAAKPTRYVENIARRLGIDAYLLRHNGRSGEDLKNLSLTNLATGKRTNFSAESYARFVEEECRKHNRLYHPHLLIT